jgi:hypothetical protein
MDSEIIQSVNYDNYDEWKLKYFTMQKYNLKKFL